MILVNVLEEFWRSVTVALFARRWGLDRIGQRRSYAEGEPRTERREKTHSIFGDIDVQVTMPRT